MEKSWIIWLALFVGALILESLSMQLFSIWFAAGAVAALIASLFGAELWVQVVLFTAVTGVSLLATRPLVRKLLVRNQTRTNADRWVGQPAIVLEEIDNVKGTGLIKVGGITWSARAQDGCVIPEGASVCTVSIQGAKMFVAPAA